MTFLYASEADETLERIDLEGAQNGIAHLRQLGFGGETTGSAFTDSETVSYTHLTLPTNREV